MIAIPDKIVQAAIVKYQSIIDTDTATLIKKLKALKNSHSAKKRKYISCLLDIADDLVMMKPNKLLAEKRKFDKIISPKTMSSKKYTKYKDSILNALGYNSRRGDFYPIYFQTIGIKACVYCNSQLTVSAEIEKGKSKTTEVVGKFQVDHYWAKSNYPCFSISLYNLYPCCASCNNTKRANDVDFLLYSAAAQVTKSGYSFRIDPASVTNYFLSGDPEEIELTFGEPPKRKGKQTFNETFGVSGIYNTQKDLAEEIIVKAQIYTPTFKKSMEKEFKNLFPRPGFIEQMILGNYYIEKDMHKRPFSKFSMDIAKDLGLLP